MYLSFIYFFISLSDQFVLLVLCERYRLIKYYVNKGEKFKFRENLRNVYLVNKLVNFLINCSDMILEVLFKGCYRFIMIVVDNENFILISENCFLVRKIWKILVRQMVLFVVN